MYWELVVRLLDTKVQDQDTSKAYILIQKYNHRSFEMLELVRVE